MTAPLDHQRAYFCELGAGYADGYAISLPFLAGVRAALSPHVHGDTLDIGNGGLVTWDLGRAGRATFVDLCAQGLRAPKTLAAKGLRPLTPAERVELRCLQGNALELPLGDARFDTVLLCYVLHHLSVGSCRRSRAHATQALGEAARVLRPGGTLLLLENHPTWPFKLGQDLLFAPWFRAGARAGKPMPYFLSRRQVLTMLAGAFDVLVEQRIAWTSRVHQPLFPGYAPPGWLWEWVLTNRLYVARRRPMLKA